MLETVEPDPNVGSRGSTNERLLCECEDGPFGWSLRIRTMASQCSRSVVALTWRGPESCVYQANDGDAMPGLLRRTEEFKPMTTHK